MGGDVFEYQAASHARTKDALKDTKSFLKELIEANKESRLGETQQLLKKTITNVIVFFMVSKKGLEPSRR